MRRYHGFSLYTSLYCHEHDKHLLACLAHL